MLTGLSSRFQLHNGVEIPCVGFGTWKANAGETTYKAVLQAFASGYRHIDNAAVYMNEENVGEAVRDCCIPRNQLFITSKLNNQLQGYDSALKGFNQTLQNLGLEYVDLYLIHWPRVLGRENEWEKLHKDTWRAFEHLYKEGYVRSIGISNFLVHYMEPLMETAQILPMVNQLEIHPCFVPEEEVKYCRNHNIVIEAWAPFMQGKAFEIPLLSEIARKYGITIAQLCVRWSLQMGFIPLPKSEKRERIINQGDIFGFEISEEDLKRMMALRSIYRLHDPDVKAF